MVALLKIGAFGAMHFNIFSEVPTQPEHVPSALETIGGQAATLAASTVGPREALAQEEEKPEGEGADTTATEPQEMPADWQALKARSDALDRREEQLNTLERQIEQKLAQMRELEQQIQTMLEEADATRDDKFKHLVDVYSNMKAKQAADALAKLDQPIAVKILSGMRGRQAGEVLSQMDANTAARLSEALTQMQVPFAN